VVKASLAILCAAVFGAAGSVARGNTVYVNGFGVGGWSSWETRDPGGTLLVGLTDSSADAPAYFTATATSSSDTGIQKQIIFMDSGASAKVQAGSPTLTGPTGSLNEDGYVRLDAGIGNSGKADLSYVDLSGIAAASVLDDANFALDYHYYLQPYSSIHSLALNITVRGTDGADYTLTHFDSRSGGGWASISITDNSGTFSLTKKGSSTGLGGGKTLDDYFHDSTLGSVLFGPGARVVRVGFSIGNNGGNAAEYVDWVQTTLLNGGDMIDFVGPSTVVLSDTPVAAPLPTSAGAGGILFAIMAGGVLLRRKAGRAGVE
jgi:hypothetical protein